MSYKKRCRICGEEKIVAEILGVCRVMYSTNPEKAKSCIARAHKSSRVPYSLPYPPPNQSEIGCNLCSNYCKFEKIRGDSVA